MAFRVGLPVERKPEASRHRSHEPGFGADETVAVRPSLIRHAPAFVLLAIAIVDAARYADGDLWIHIRSGQTILNTGHILRHDPFSYSAAGHLWRNHEWLAQVALAFSYDSVGVVGLKLLKFLCAAATVVAIAVGLSATIAPARVQRAVLALTALALAPQMQFRPHLFTFAALSCLFALFARDIQRKDANLWLAIPLFALWANLHGGFVVGLGAFVTYGGVVAIQELCRQRRLQRAPRIAAIMVACALATLINPFGIEIWSNIVRSLGNSTIRIGVSEWQPLPTMLAFQWHDSVLGTVMYLLPLALFTTLALSFYLAPSLDDTPMLAIASAFVIGAFLSTRNMALAVIAVSIPLAHHLGLVLARRPAAPERFDDARFSPVIGTALALALMIGSGMFTKHLRTFLTYPGGAVEFMQQHHLRGNLFNDFNWGGYLIWHVAPESRVFIDGRCELVYPTYVIVDYLAFYFDLPGADTVLTKYPHDFVLMPPTSRGYGVVARDSNWKLIYRDADAALFARSGSEAARLRGTPAVGTAKRQAFP